MCGQVCHIQVSFHTKDHSVYLRVTKDELEHFEILQPGDNFRKLDFEPNVATVPRQHLIKSELLEIYFS